MPSKNDRVELEMKIMKYRALARQTMDDLTKRRIEQLISETEQRLREIDERM
jgi:hypothetical protein